MVREGHRAVMVYLIQRNDANSLSLARDVDASYGRSEENPLQREQLTVQDFAHSHRRGQHHVGLRLSAHRHHLAEIAREHRS